MHLKKGIDYIQFLNALQNCSQDVYFITEEGDRLNLQSELTMLIFATLVKRPEVMEKARIYCANPSDYTDLKDFLTD